VSRLPDHRWGLRGAVIPASLSLPAWVVVATVLGAIGPASAQVDPAIPPDFAERVAFGAADTNDDGYVSEAELARDAAAGFSGLDRDGSGTLTPEELGPHDPALFARVDRNGDGVLTFPEVMANKVRGFEDGDRNDDGLLSFQEMVDEVEVELGAAR
jgi:hypothetical protein